MEPVTEQATASTSLAPTAQTIEVARIEPPTDRTPDLASGRTIFSQLCAACHGPTGEGGEQGVELVGKTFTPADIMTIANYGRNTMPAFGFAYTPEELHDVAGYIIQEVLAE